jgi:hypothetical protein
MRRATRQPAASAFLAKPRGLSKTHFTAPLREACRVPALGCGRTWDWVPARAIDVPRIREKVRAGETQSRTTGPRGRRGFRPILHSRSLFSRPPLACPF